MPFDLAQSLQNLGVAAELGMEIQRQIAAGTGNAGMLLEVGLVPMDAVNLAAGVTAGTISADLLTTGSIVPAVAVVIAQAVSLPRNTVLPAITGTAQVGQTLTGATGTWTGTGNTYARQWTANGVDIVGATAGTYVPIIGQIGQVIRERVTATNASGSVSATSLPTAAVIAA